MAPRARKQARTVRKPARRAPRRKPRARTPARARMPHAAHAAPTVANRAEVLALAQGLLLTAMSVGGTIPRGQAAREFVRIARDVIAEVDVATPSPIAAASEKAQRQARRVTVAQGDDDESGADVSRLDEEMFPS